MPQTGRVRVLGLGNVLMGDDGLGPFAAHFFASQYECPDAVSIEDVGTPGLDLIPYLTDADAIIILDTVKSDAPPGTLRRYDRDALLKNPPPPRLSPHDPGVTEALGALQLAGQGPDQVVLLGVVPGPIVMNPGLSPAVRRAVDGLVAALLAELERLGTPARPRQVPLPFAPWWEVEPRDVC